MPAPPHHRPGATPPTVPWLLLAASLACGGAGPGASRAGTGTTATANDATTTGTGPASGASGGAPADGDGRASGRTATTAGGPSGSVAQGPAASGCAALLPAPGRPVVVEFAWPAACDGATSSASGDVGLGILDVRNAPPPGAFVLFTADGRRLGAAGDAFAGDPNFHPTAGGYQGIAAGDGALRCAAWDRAGAMQSIPCGGSPVTSAPTAAGGSVFVVGPAAGGDQLLVRTGADGGVTSTRPLGGSATLVLEARQTAHVVAVDLSRSGPRARWFDGSGGPLTPWFPVTARTAAYGASLALLVDGAVALHDGSAWTALLRDGVASAGDPPAWLAARPAARIATIRGGSGHAAFPVDPAGVASFEVLTGDGESCGNVTLPVDAVTRLDRGHDGTVFTSEIVPPTTAGPGCRYRWWPALLR